MLCKQSGVFPSERVSEDRLKWWRVVGYFLYLNSALCLRLNLCPFISEKKRKNYSPSLILTNSLSLPLLFHFTLSLSAPPFPLLALPPTHAYIGMEMRESCTLAANIQIQSARPDKKGSPTACQPLKLLKQELLQTMLA